MSKTLYGKTTVTVGEFEFELEPTLAAVRKIEQRFGGLRPALDGLGSLSVDAVTRRKPRKYRRPSSPLAWPT